MFSHSTVPPLHQYFFHVDLFYFSITAIVRRYLTATKSCYGFRLHFFCRYQQSLFIYLLSISLSSKGCLLKSLASFNTISHTFSLFLKFLYTYAIESYLPLQLPLYTPTTCSFLLILHTLLSLFLVCSTLSSISAACPFVQWCGPSHWSIGNLSVGTSSQKKSSQQLSSLVTQTHPTA